MITSSTNASARICSRPTAITSWSSRISTHELTRLVLVMGGIAGAINGAAVSAVSSWVRCLPGILKYPCKPSGLYSRVLVPPRSKGILRSISTEPKPLRLGGRTVGPPLSHHAISQPPPESIVQLTASLPPARDSAPYFAALVASS
ncbi:hypothetical protein D3C79_835870 [compost metagenome]